MNKLINTEKRMPEGNSPKAYNTVKAVTNIQQYKSADVENSSYDIFMESTTSEMLDCDVVAHTIRICLRR